MTALLNTLSYYYYLIIFYTKRLRWQKFEIISATFFGFLDSALVGFGWFILAKYSNIEIDEVKLFTYYLFAWLITFLCFAQIQPSQRIQKEVITGEFNNVLLRPINPIWHYASVMTGQMMTTRVIALIIILIYFFLAIFTSPLNILLSVILIINAIFINIGIASLISALWFVFLDAKGLKNSILHVLRFFQGAIIPFYLMPENLAIYFQINPTAYGLYWPIQALKGETVVVHHVFISFLWAFVIYYFGNLVFHKSLKKYEGVGL